MQITEVRISDRAQGRLFISDMPGIHGDFSADRTLINETLINTVFCLTTEAELQSKSPDYFQTLNDGGLEWKHFHIPIPASGVPHQLGEFVTGIDIGLKTLQKNENVLIHCDTGMGRTALFGIILLMRIGYEQLEAFTRLAEADSGIETSEQETLVDYLAGLDGSMVNLEETQSSS